MAILQLSAELIFSAGTANPANPHRIHQKEAIMLIESNLARDPLESFFRDLRVLIRKKRYQIYRHACGIRLYRVGDQTYPYREFNPLTAVYFEKSRRYLKVREYKKAACKMGLTPEVAWLLVCAFDCNTPVVRFDISERLDQIIKI